MAGDRSAIRWFEVIRGPRPQAQKWLFAPSRQPAQQSRQPAQQWRQLQMDQHRAARRLLGPRRGLGASLVDRSPTIHRVRASPEASSPAHANAVVKLEAALQFSGSRVR